MWYSDCSVETLAWTFSDIMFVRQNHWEIKMHLYSTDHLVRDIVQYDILKIVLGLYQLIDQCSNYVAKMEH